MRLTVEAPAVSGENVVLTPEALSFVQALHQTFADRREALMAERRIRRAEVVRTKTLGFLDETADVRAAEWSVAPAPPDLLDRRVEITGPAERRMTVNALTSGARVWLADLEDASTPHWSNVVGSQVNLMDAIRRDIAFTGPGGKAYMLPQHGRLATIVMRPRGWHLDEPRLRIDSRPTAAALVDFGLYFFHNAHELLARGSAPYFYLPKLESHREARLWNDVFVFAQEWLGVPRGTVRATVLIETIPAVFEMDEILFALREHVSGLNAGRWDLGKELKIPPIAVDSPSARRARATSSAPTRFSTISAVAKTSPVVSTAVIIMTTIIETIAASANLGTPK